jgi:glycosyltransferase involved in cell wall biosynthesis
VTCHDLIPYKYPEHYARLEDGYGWGRRALDRRRYRSASQVIAISRATARDLEERLHLGSSRVSIVLSGIDAARWRQTNRVQEDGGHLEQLGLRGRRFILYVGDADWRKNSEGMLRGLAIARRTEPELELVWVGMPSSAAHDNTRRAEAERAGVSHAVRFLGYVTDAALGAVYRAAVATLLVSRAEGFGYPVLEAMAAGSPVITSNTSSMPEVGGDAALLVDPENPSAIADAIALLARDPERRRELLKKGFERAQELNLLAQARGTLAVYRSLLDRTAAARPGRPMSP